jgi:hypothetical protein
MAGLINKAKEVRLDHWLVGIHLVEHGVTNMDDMLPFTIDIATRVNTLTHGWLQQPGHGFLANGGGWGADYRGIDKVKCSADVAPRFSCSLGSPLPFFQLMAQQTGWFAFGYKFMEFKKVDYYGQTERNMSGLIEAYCRRFNACDPHNLRSVDWENFLSDDINGLGFSDLRRFIAAAAGQYSRHANVVFVGDNSDSVATMVDMRKAACTPSEPLCAVQALSHLFIEAATHGGDWNGRLFINGIEDASTETMAHGQSSDNGRSLNFIDYNPLSSQGSTEIIKDDQTLSLWQSWPHVSANYDFETRRRHGRGGKNDF